MCRPASLDPSSHMTANGTSLLVIVQFIWSYSLLFFPKDFSKDAVVPRLPLNKTEENSTHKGKLIQFLQLN